MLPGNLLNLVHAPLILFFSAEKVRRHPGADDLDRQRRTDDFPADAKDIGIRM